MSEIYLDRRSACFAPYCRRVAPAGYIFCRAHWNELPHATRRNLILAQQRKVAGLIGSSEAMANTAADAIRILDGCA